jgi:hypothetical protein
MEGLLPSLLTIVAGCQKKVAVVVVAGKESRHDGWLKEGWPKLILRHNLVRESMAATIHEQYGKTFPAHSYVAFKSVSLLPLACFLDLEFHTI